MIDRNDADEHDGEDDDDDDDDDDEWGARGSEGWGEEGGMMKEGTEEWDCSFLAKSKKAR